MNSNQRRKARRRYPVTVMLPAQKSYDKLAEIADWSNNLFGKDNWTWDGTTWTPIKVSFVKQEHATMFLLKWR